MSKQHTHEPWDTDGFSSVGATGSDQFNGGFFTATCDGPDKIANAGRIVACVNACAGIETHELELMTGRMSIASQIKACDAIYATAEAKATRRSKFARQRDELLAAIEQTLDENGHLADGENCTLIVLKKALVKVKDAA